jgi:ankyrin repeat protein
MSNAKLPERASLEYLKKLAKDRLRELRRADPQAQLATAQLAVARDHGFASWRALKTEVERRQTDDVARFFEACAKGDVDALRGMLAQNPELVRTVNPQAPHAGWTGLHSAAQAGHAGAVRLLLENGADPNAREAGDNTYPLHWAAAGAHFENIRALLDAGGDVHGFGDVHELDTIGWATVYHGPDEDTARIAGRRREAVDLLLQRGARHHIFSAIAAGDPDPIRTLVEQDPDALDRRMSRFEQKQTPLHFAMSRKRYDLLDLLIELGADLEAPDQRGQTALAAATLRGDREAMTRLETAGAKPLAAVPAADFRTGMTEHAGAVRKGIPQIRVTDIARTLDWYVAIGFQEIGRYADGRNVAWGMVRFGNADIAFDVGGKAGPHDVSLWFEVSRIDGLYQLLRTRQIDGGAVPFEEDLYEPFYGGRQFSIRDPDGYNLIFYQPDE